MAFNLYNTYTRKQEKFMPIKKKNVGIYSCGPTVYDYAHIGNFRAYIIADLLRRWLEFKGFHVKQVMNLTDVDDKTIKGSIEKKTTLGKYTEKYKKAFFEDIKELNILPASVYPSAIEHIDEMVKLVKALIKKGYAYKSKDGSVYFDISKCKNYGKLARLKVKELKVCARVKQDQYEKEQAQDFALWKGWTPEDGKVFWDTEIGKGRPGWHIECSAMGIKHLGKHFDIHTGGVDLIFPHHENEVAQSEAYTGKKFVNWFVHNEHLLVDGKKMSKSLGNFYTLRDLLKEGYSKKAIRFLLIGTHYRQKLNFTIDGLKGAANSVERIIDFLEMLDEVKNTKEVGGVKKIIADTRKGFEEAMDDDLNISKALAFVFDMIREINRINSIGRLSLMDAKCVKELMLDFDKVLGIMEIVKEDISAKVEKLIIAREKARKEKDFKKSDSIRDELAKIGVILEDSPDGVKWKIRRS